MEKPVKNWLSDHFSEALAVVIIVVGNIIGYAKLLYTSLSNSDKLRQIEHDLEKHMDPATSLHRNPDFERRFEILDGKINRIDQKLDQLLSQRPTKGY